MPINPYSISSFTVLRSLIHIHFANSFGRMPSAGISDMLRMIYTACSDNANRDTNL